MSSRIQLRRGPKANWAAANPVLFAGEPGYETDTGVAKFGDAATAWTSLDSVAVVHPGSAIALPVFHAAKPSGDTSGATDATALTAVIAALPAAGGTIALQPGIYYDNTQRVLDDKTSIVMRGAGGMSGGATPGTSLVYTGTAASYFSCRSISGFALSDLQVLYNSASFTGLLFDFSHSAGLGTDAHYIVFERVGLAGAGIRTAAILVSLDNATQATFRNVTFQNATTAVRGRSVVGNFSNVVTFEGTCGFNNMVAAPILNPGESWTLKGCNFEPLFSGAAGAILQNLATPDMSLLVEGCWMGDANTSGNWMDFEAACNGVTLLSNRVGNGAGGVVVNAAIKYLTMSGNVFDLTTNGLVVFVQGSDWLIHPNDFSRCGTAGISWAAGTTPNRSIVADSKAGTFDQYGTIRVVPGVVSDSSFPKPPPDGTQAIDSVNGRAYFRYGGAWHFATLT